MRDVLLRSETMPERRDLGTRLDINYDITYDLSYKVLFTCTTRRVLTTAVASAGRCRRRVHLRTKYMYRYGRTTIAG